MNQPKCHGLGINPELKCTPEMINLCEQEDGVRCNGHGQVGDREPGFTPMSKAGRGRIDVVMKELK